MKSKIVEELVEGLPQSFIFSAALLLAWLAALAPRAHAQGGVPLWTNRYGGPENYTDQVTAIAVDSSSNVFVTGYSFGGASEFDYATVAYSSAGEPLWTNRYDGPENYVDRATAIAVDSSGNVFVTGYSSGGAGHLDYATIKYSSAGVPLWINRYNGLGNSSGDNARAVAVDKSGNVFVTGRSIGVGSDYDYATVAYSGTGVPLWTNRYNGPDNFADEATAIALDRSGNVFVTGRSASTNVSPFNFHYATVAYSGVGVPLWTNRYTGPGNRDDQAHALAVDSTGNVFVTGNSIGDGSDYDYATVAYSGTGVPLWTNRYNGPGNGEDDAWAVSVDNRGKLFVTGQSWNGTDYDYATVAYSSAGVLLWANCYNGKGSGNDFANAMALDDSGNVFVTGGSYVSLFNYDYATVAYSGAGMPLWTNCYNGPGNSFDHANTIAVDSTGNVFVTGYSIGDGSYQDYATIKYSASVPAVRLDFQRLNNQLVLSWTNSDFSLQSAPAISGTFTNIPGATSPHTNNITGPQQYFRLKSN